MKTLLLGIALLLATTLSAQSRTHNYAIGESKDLMMLKTKHILSGIDGMEDISVKKHYVTNDYLDISIEKGHLRGRYEWVFLNDYFTMSGKDVHYYDDETKTWKPISQEQKDIATDYLREMIDIMMNEIIF